MPTLAVTALKIGRLAGGNCSVLYTYTLTCTPAELVAGATFSLSSELWGRDPIQDDMLGAPPYDPHTVSCLTPMPNTRVFTVHCSVLDEDRPRQSDEILLRLKALPAAGGTTTAADSPTVTWDQ